MPFKSKAQMRYLYARHPKIARKFAKKTGNVKRLPERKRLSPNRGRFHD